MKKLLSASLIGLLALYLACDSKQPQQTTTALAGTTASKESPETIIFGQKGKVVVALLGIDGCPQTKIATEVLARMSQDCPADLVLARLDVPVQSDSPFKPLANWTYNYRYAVDADRAAADRLGFFYYPTLYILDRDGEVRYSGSCDEAKLKAMVSEIQLEKLGDPKKIYTPTLPAIGTQAPLFRAKNLEGGEIELKPLADKGPTLLFFTSVACPFSIQAARKLPALEQEFRGKDVGIIVIEKGTDAAVINTTYLQIGFSNRVIMDTDNAISQKYGVEPVPFYFVIDKAGKIAARGPYTESAASQAIGMLLGMQPVEPKGKPASGAG